VPFLRTLGKRELLNGLAEMIKHALIRDTEHWEAIANAPLHDIEALVPLIERSAAIKAAIVKSDPREGGVRRVLNFGTPSATRWKHSPGRARNAVCCTARPSPSA
jgi:3-dehydroquinate synthase